MLLVVDRDGLEVPDEGGPVVPGGAGRALGDVVAPQGGDRDAHDVVEADLDGEGPVVGFDGLEHRVGVVDEVELVHGHDDVADAEQGDEVAVPPRLGEDSLPCVDEDDGQVGG